MATILPTRSIYYNDCNLLPRVGKIKSRSKDVPSEKWRIIASPMEAVVGETFVKEAAQCGISVCLHRFQDFNNQMLMLRVFELYRIEGDKNFAIVSVGLSDLAKTEKELLYCKEVGVRHICLDIANGYLPQIKDFAELLKRIDYTPHLFIGNINTKEGVQYLYSLFFGLVDTLSLRVGIGGGSPCITASSTGVNRGNVTELIECSEEADVLNGRELFFDSSNKPVMSFIRTVADGGIRDSSYACKAFAAGADYLFIGGFFMNAKEAESHVIGDGTYWGGASHKQLARNGVDIKTKHAEGKVIEKDPNKQLIPLNDLINNLWGGITSYVSYSGYDSLSKAIGNGIFEIKENSLPPKNR